MIELKRLALFARKRLPNPIRRALRVGHYLFTTGQSSVQIPAHLLSSCGMCASRTDLAELLPRGGLIAEVGTDRGHFARHILAKCDPAKLHLIDLDFAQLQPAVAQDARVVTHMGYSHEILEKFPDNSFDWIYIDADHSYAGASRDAIAAASKVKPGGYLVFNDFAHMDPYFGSYGVHRAVVDFAVSHGWGFLWLAYEPNALYDVALQRPQI
jgi:Methyltransferase domain